MQCTLAAPVVIQTVSSGATVQNMSIINSIQSQIPSKKKKKKRQALAQALTLDCIGAQGTHLPVWFTDNPNTGNTSDGGRVHSSDYAFVQMLSDYVSRLFVLGLSSESVGDYYCRSEISGDSTGFFLTNGVLINRPLNFHHYKLLRLIRNQW